MGVRAEYLNSSLTTGEARRVGARLQAGDLDLIYVAPERLLTDRRPNIRYQVGRETGGARDALLRFIQSSHTGESGIVYCLSRKGVEEVTAWLGYAERWGGVSRSHPGIRMNPFVDTPCFRARAMRSGCDAVRLDDPEMKPDEQQDEQCDG